MDVRFICTLDTYEYFDVKENDKNHIRPEDKTFSHIKWWEKQWWFGKGPIGDAIPKLNRKAMA